MRVRIPSRVRMIMTRRITVDDTVKLDLVSNVQDNRSVPLNQLAMATENDGLRRVLSVNDRGRVAVAAFGSCI